MEEANENFFGSIQTLSISWVGFLEVDVFL